jgi:hypothetical protein
MDAFLTGWSAELLSNLVTSAIVFVCGLAIGKAREQRSLRGRNLEEYEFYPFTVDGSQQLQFDLGLFMRAVDHFLAHRDRIAAQQLLLIGEQNRVRELLDSPQRARYLRLYRKYDGQRILDDAQSWLANYARIVDQLGESFRDLGIELLLHNLTNPSRSLMALANNVTGRRIGDGATNLVLDLKRRRYRNEDKINYELNIGARRFKCTTIPIYRADYGLIGALCVNVDANYLIEDVAPSPARSAAFFREFCRTRMTLEENILSSDEYAKALGGKRHWRDTAV